MNQRAIYFIARDPLRYEPIRDKTGEVRRFSEAGERAFMRRWLGRRWASLSSFNYSAEPNHNALRFVGDRIVSVSGDSNLPGRTDAAA